MEIRPALSRDSNSISALFRRNFGEDVDLYPLADAKSLVVAMDNDEMIGAGGIFVSFVHGALSKVGIAVDMDFRRNRVGSRIHRALIDSVPPQPIGFDGACSETNLPSIRFMESLGYEPYLDCSTITVDLQTKNEFDSNRSVQSLSEVMGHQIAQQEVVDFLVARYSETHFWSPVTLSPSDKRWNAIALGDVDFELSSIALEDHKILGVSTATAISRNEIQVIWTYCRNIEVREQVLVLKALLIYQFELASSRGIKVASFEIDSTDEALSAIKNWLPIKETEIWKRFRLSGG